VLRRRIAFAVSMATAPQIYGGIVSTMVWWGGRLGGLEALLVLLVSHTLLPLLPIVVDAVRGRVNIFVSEREKRWKYYLLSIASYALAVAYAWWRDYKPYLVMSVSYAASAASLALITVLAKWKISVHTAGVAGPTTALLLIGGREAALLYLLLAPVAWARYELREHTPAQLAAGAIVAAASTLLVFACAPLPGAGTWHPRACGDDPVESAANAFLGFLEESSPPLRALLIGLIPALMTALGSIPVLVGVGMSERASDAGMGFAAGVMLVASFTSLLLPAVERGGPLAATAGFLLGAGLIKLLDALLPHLHPGRGLEGVARPLAKSTLLALAMVVHNVPEGMAVGVASFESVDEGLLLAVAIGLQDVPEGLAVALPLAARGRVVAFLIGVASGVSEALVAPLPALLLESVREALPLLMGLAAGAMIYVVVHEVVPEIYGHEHDEPSTLGFFTGFTAMLLLDVLFG